jgi:hypothetical protein
MIKKLKKNKFKKYFTDYSVINKSKLIKFLQIKFYNKILTNTQNTVVKETKQHFTDYSIINKPKLVIFLFFFRIVPL